MSVGTSQNNYLAFEVRVVSSGLGGSSLQGSLITYWPGVPGQGANGCSATVDWPILDNVTVLGVPAVNTASVAVQVHSPFTANARSCLAIAVQICLEQCRVGHPLAQTAQVFTNAVLDSANTGREEDARH